MPTRQQKARKKGSDEGFYLDASGRRQDSALHEPILADHDGSTRADLQAIGQAVDRGVPLQTAAGLYAGAGARALLRRQGMIL